eukprot:TRINITY_DN6922_c0_g1_i1.p1 TRINITY_DN6922_c0_g1~~TRINITY_DN6922_c0_g1_i1.p1  ORF type:complete len:740 (+),score=331.47 TRINITY_DN6922_c0_g1_i1:78-2297(+)
MTAFLHAVGALLKGMDFLAWLLSLGPVWMLLAKSKVQSVRAKAVDKADINGSMPPSPVFWSTAAIRQGALTTKPLPDVSTLYDLFIRAVKLYGPQKSLGTRRLLENKMIEGIRFPTKVFGETDWRTYQQVGEEAVNFGCGLRALGMQPLHLAANESFDDAKGPNMVLMYEETCAEWLIAANGIMSQSLTVATAYATLGVDAVVGAVNEGHIATIVCNYTSVKKLLAAKDRMPSLKNIVFTTANLTREQVKNHPGQDDTVTVLSFEEVVQKGRESGLQPEAPQASDVAILMYTSGSTGKPKGVVVRHSQIVCLVRAIKERAELGEGEHFVAYLPLAHIFEMQMEFFCFAYGGEIGYADPKTLVAGPGKCEPVGALMHFRPTMMGAVPKVWETIKSGAEAKVRKQGGAKEFLFFEALEWKKAAMTNFRGTPIFDKLVFAKIKETLGGRLKFAVSGGGAISTSVQDWIRAAFGCPLVQGYGLTETSAGLTLQTRDDWRSGVVGAPLDTVAVCLHSEPEITDIKGHPYLATDTEHLGEPCLGRGEVWAKGTNITDGYYQRKEATAEAYLKDGWFATGDIAIVLPDGSFKIVDRKKNLVKLKGGEYIALEHMNQVYNTSPYVDVDAGGCCSYGDGEMDRPVCFVQCKEEKLRELGQQLGLASTEPAALVKDPKVQNEIMAHLNKLGKNYPQPLTGLETLFGVVLVVNPWSPDEGTLTSTLKIVPKQIQLKHAAELAEVKPKAIR